AAAPRRCDEPRGVAEVPDHVVVAARVAERSPLLFGSRGLEERRLDVAQQLVDRDRHARQRYLPLLAGIAARDGHCLFREVATSDLDPHRRTLQLPLVELEAGPVVRAVVDADADTARAQLVA